MIFSTLENGKITRLKVNDISFALSCDVLCVGAGSAGVYAADAAATEGASVILCEISSNIGGMHVCGNVTGYYYGFRGGSFEEDDAKCKIDTAFISNGANWEQKQIHLTERLQRSGVKILCRHSATGIYFEGDRAVGLRVFDGEKEIDIGAKMIIDATSDGHLIRMTDVKKNYGRKTDGSFVPFTVRVQCVKDGKLVSNNNDSGHMDHYDKNSFSKNAIFAHASASNMLTKGEMINLASQTGIREGLSFEGEDCVRYTDLILEKRPEKVLFWAYSDLDRHGAERATEEEMFQNWWVISNLSTVLIRIPVPMGSVVPKGIKGLITAGRCLSCDTYSQSAVRMNRDMFRMGECIGVASAMAAESGDILSIDYEDYLTRVNKRGCFAGYADRAFGFDNSYSHYLQKMKSLDRTPDPRYKDLSPRDFIYEPVEFDAEKNFHLLKTDAPGVAIWSCFVSKEQEIIKEKLYGEMISAEDDLYRGNCAIALGLMNDTRALAVLRRIIDNRDCFFFTDNRRTNQFRSAVAVCLLGRMGDESDLDRLFDILSDGEIEKEMYHTLKANYLYHNLPDRNFVYFSMLTHTCFAVYKIYQRFGLDSSKLHAYFAELFSGDKILRRVTDVPKDQPAYEEIEAFIKYMLKITSEK